MRMLHVPTIRKTARYARQSRVLPLALIAMVMAACATPRHTYPATANVNDTLQALAQRHRVCAVVVAVIKNRRLDAVESATGCLPAPAVHGGSVFQAASLSKPVFAYGVLKLVEQGKLALDAPVMTYLPQGYRHQFTLVKTEPSELVADRRLQEVTVRMVLNHTSGLPNWASGPLTFDVAPGKKWHYSGEAYVLLQRAVETVTGQPLDQFMTSLVLTPSGMHQSDYVWRNRFAKNVIAGKKADGSPRTTMVLREPNAAFSLHTTAADYGAFLAKVLNDDALLRQLAAAPVSVDANLGVSWGLGWGMARTANDAYIWHWGNNPGYRAFVMASLSNGDGFVMLTNSENGLKLAQPMANKLLPGDHKLFSSPMLGDDVATVLCNSIRICL